VPPLTRLLLLAFLLVLAGSARGAEWTLPPIDGELSGDVSPLLLPGAPDLHWRIAVSTTGPETRRATLSLDGEGARVRAEAELRGAKLTGTWKLTEATIDAKRWLPALAPLIQLPSGIQGSGVLAVVGEGELREGKPAGALHVSAKDLALSDPAAGWSLEGIVLQASLACALADSLSVRSTGPTTLTVARISTNRFGAQNLVVNGLLKSLGAFDITAATVEIAGGTATVSPTTVSLQPLALTVDLQLTRIGLQDVAALVPDLVTAAYGRVDGEVRLGWSKASGLVLQKGHVVLRSDEPASVTLAPSPGLITGTLPKTVLKYYPGLDKAELGKVPIRASALDAEFSATPDSEGRTAIVRMFGVPDAPDARGPIDLNLNVRGPLQPFIKLGTNTRFSVGVR
jgi:hypothetical protein